MEPNIAELERRYQTLLNDYRTGVINEATFTAEVNKLQFQDNGSRYWMIGAQTGNWHYYDGQNWRQADPNDADKLPIMDAQGRYWQRGAKSGDWYYYQPETNEWVKPGLGDPTSPSFEQPRQQTGSYTPQPQQTDSYSYAPAPQPPAATGPASPADAELFQDDEGRYWSVGTKTGQWYFYDQDGWHPAQEFEARTGRVQAQSFQPTYPTAPAYSYPSNQPAPTYSSPPPAYQPQPAPVYNAPYPAQNYAPAPQQVREQTAPYTPAPAPTPTPAPTPAEQPGSAAPSPGQPSGSWFYFDGKQWLQYSTGEPAADTPPNPGLIVDQPAKETRPKPKAEPASQPIVAEYIEEEDPPIEVVDVEVITVFEAEPNIPAEPKPQPQLQPQPQAQPQPQPQPTKPVPVAAPVRPRRESVEVEEPVVAKTATSPGSPLPADEVVPRRTKTAPEIPVAKRPAAPVESQPVPQRRTPTAPVAPVAPVSVPTPTEPSRPVSPRKRAQDAQEPTIIIPTGSTTATTPSAARVAPRASRPTAPIPAQQARRARENTLPMEPVTAPPAAPASTTDRNRQITQAMPVVQVPPPAAPVPTPAAEAPQVEREQRAKQKTLENIPAVAPVKPVEPKKPEEEKEGYTLGDILRSFPSTLWTGIAGVAVLVIFAVAIIAVFMYGSNLLGGSSAAALPNSTPTLPAGPPDSTPTPGPTPTGDNTTSPVATPTEAALTTLSSAAVGITVEYPENWKTGEVNDSVVMAPTTDGLKLENISEAKMVIGRPAITGTAIADILANVLTRFPSGAENLNEGTISIGSQTWTSTQIRFDDKTKNRQGIATLAVTSKDGAGYYLVASAPASDWNSVQPVFQSMINSFRFGAEKIVAKAAASPTSQATITTSITVSSTITGTVVATTAQVSAQTTATATVQPAPKATPTVAVTVTPLVYSIQSGDTLLAIANKFGVDVDLLTSENDIKNPSSLQLGQELVIPFTAEQLTAYNASGSAAAVKSAGSTAATTTVTTTTTATGTAVAAKANPAAAAATPVVTATAQTAAAPMKGRIVYPAFNTGTGSYDVWMANLATNEQTPIAGAASQPAFNKDGSLLAYRSWDRGSRGIFFRDFIGGRGDIVTKFVEDALPAWSPDGLSFAFSSRKEGDRVPRIYIGNQNGETPFSIGFQGEYPSVMPDGRLLVKGCTPAGDCGLFLMGPRGGGEKKITDIPSDTSPSPSPNGSKIAFMSFDRGGANNWEVWVMGPDGANPQRLTQNPSADGLPAWSPDGQSIAFVSNREGAWAIWVMNADGSNQHKLLDMKGPPDGKVLYDDFNSRGWLEERISWAP